MLIMRPSAIAGKDISRIIILFLVISTFVFVAGALYVAMTLKTEVRSEILF